MIPTINTLHIKSVNRHIQSKTILDRRRFESLIQEFLVSGIQSTGHMTQQSVLKLKRRKKSVGMTSKYGIYIVVDKFCPLGQRCFWSTLVLVNAGAGQLFT